MKSLLTVFLTLLTLTMYGQSLVNFIPDKVVLTKYESNEVKGERTIKAYERITFTNGFKATGPFKACLVSRTDNDCERKDSFETTAIKDDDALSFYPNPADDRIYFKGKHERKQMIILNESGSPVFAFVLQGENPEVDVSVLLKGNYVLKTGDESYHFIKN